MTEKRSFEIDPDIRRAWTPPSWVYTDPAFCEAMCERIFSPSWQFVADAEVVRVPGQVYPFTLLEGCLNEPLLLTRDMEDGLHCVSNVCTHRGNLVCEHAGVERTLRCRYHGRKFGLDGKFQFMPDFKEAANFPSAKDDLPPLPIKRWGPLLFTSLRRDGEQKFGEFDEVFAPMRTRLAWLPLDQARFDAARSRDYLVRANWALYCENYLEGFHIQFVHPSLADQIDFASYRTELHRWSSLQLALARGGEHAFEPPAGSADDGLRVAAYYYWVFPNMMFNVYPWGLSLNVVKPLGIELTRVSFLSFVWDESKLEIGAGAGLDRVEREDEAVVECVQKGLHSRLYERGRYSPTREQGTHHFHRLLAEFLG